jgi:DNA-binding GntR family transcriptional regulator
MLTLFTANEKPVSLNLNTLLLSEQVYQYLRKEMASGNILPDSNINIANIAAQLGISKTPLRDALIHLEVEGFVTILPRKGVVVNKMTIEEVRQAYDAICVVESAIVQANGDRMTDLHIKQLRELNELMIADIKRDDYSRYFETTWSFTTSICNSRTISSSRSSSCRSSSGSRTSRAKAISKNGS